KVEAVRDRVVRLLSGVNPQVAEVEHVADVIRELENSWNATIKAHDVEGAAAILSPTFCLLTAIEGRPLQKLSRAEWLVMLKKQQLDSLSIDDVHVGVYGNIAVATLRCRQTGRIRESDQHVSGDFMLTDVWINTSRGWELVERHVSRAAPAHPGP